MGYMYITYVGNRCCVHVAEEMGDEDSRMGEGFLCFEAHSEEFVPFTHSALGPRKCGIF